MPDSEHELIYATEYQIQLCDTRQPNYNKKPIVALPLDHRNRKAHISSLKFDPFNKSRFAA